MLDSTLYFVLYPIVGVWFLLFLYTLSYFYRFIPVKADGIFLNEKKSFEEAYEDLALLEELKNRELPKARKKIAFYENNAIRTRRKYSYYAHYIESGFIKIYIGAEKGWKKCFARLDKPIKLLLILIVSYFVLLALVIIATIIYATTIKSIFLYFVICLLVLVILLRVFRFFIKVNYLFLLILVDGFLIILKKDRNRLHRNISFMDSMMKGWWQKSSGGVIIGASGVAAYSGGSSGDFGGFGGGDFGGGGAGGSW